MVKYEVIVYTGNLAGAATMNQVFIKLVGTEGESKKTWLAPGFNVSCPVSIGKLVVIELEKHRLPLMPEDSWFPAKVEIKSPEGDTYIFPIYRWIADSKVQRFREATGFFSTRHPQGEVLKLTFLTVNLFPNEMQDHVNITVLLYRLTELKLKGLVSFKKTWSNIDDINRVFCNKKTKISEYVKEHWTEDAFFGYQFLNGVNPMLIRRCEALPSNFPVTDDMVFLSGQCGLEDEMKNGNIFLCDYKQLDGLQPNIINGKKQFLMAPLVLLHKTPDDKLKPIAIQLKQTPADDNPIFFPTDSEYDWLMAKIFVRSADFNEHQLNVHLLRTHLLAEVFAVSLLRNMPMVHPLYKLLVPHTRYTLQINHLARLLLISKNGIFTQFAAAGGDGMLTLLKKYLSSMTYTSLCIPEDIAERGLESIPNFYYRDDGLKFWDIVQRFVQGILGHYYKDDCAVEQDSELQRWISDIFEHGFLSNECTGIPKSLTSVAELVKFVTMVIFTCSGQHSAVNTGQYDYGGWMPNTPISLQRPPPTKKGTASKETMLQTFPDVNTTVQGMSTMWLLSKQSSDFVAFGQYPEDHFCEEIPRKLIRDFQGELEVLSAVIKSRNKGLEVPYTYMDPAEVENSVAI
uniref:Arachidonate 15-lipoxygenase B-like n=1 Tax=Salarias fasciatus TaxID=181472 RepID=A0A672GWP3_SALFA